jgi:hypothetical protein
MKKAAVAIAVIVVLAVAGVSYAHMWGWGGGPAYGPGYMMRGYFSAEDQKLLDETVDLRKDLHTKRFELREALRKGEYEKAETIEKEIAKLEDKLYDKVGTRTGRRYGRGFGRGPAGGTWFCPGPYGW